MTPVIARKTGTNEIKNNSEIVRNIFNNFLFAALTAEVLLEIMLSTLRPLLVSQDDMLSETTSFFSTCDFLLSLFPYFLDGTAKFECCFPTPSCNAWLLEDSYVSDSLTKNTNTRYYSLNKTKGNDKWAKTLMFICI